MPNYWVEPLGLQLHGTAVASFSNPLSLSGLVAWYDASQITGLTNGQAVATWPDLSGNGNDLTQGTAGFRPIYKTDILNGMPSVRGDGVDDRLDTSNDGLLLSQPTTIGVVVVFRSDFDNSPVIFDSLGGNRQVLWIEPVAVVPPEIHWYAGNVVAAGVNVAVDTAYIFNVVYNGASSTLRRNGTQIDADDAGSTGLDDLRLFNDFNLSNALNGDILEFWLYSAALSTAQQQQLESYAASKYGVSI